MANDSQNLNSVAEEQAYQLSESAIRMDLARVKRADNPLILMDALNRNIEVWLKLRTIIMRKDCPLPEDTSKNLVKLSQFVVERTITGAEDMSESTLDALININLQIAEGLLEGLNA
jgi:flagellar biosynthesis regulator FlaF